MREICTYGSEGGEATAFPTPIDVVAAMMAFASGGPDIPMSGTASRDPTYALLAGLIRQRYWRS